MVMKISTILCQVEDMNRAVSFYRDVLKLSPAMVSPGWSTFSLGDIQIGLHPAFAGKPSAPGRGWILGLEVSDLAGMRGRLEANGVSCSDFHDIPGGQVMDFTDPDGNPIQAMQRGVTSIRSE